MMESTDLWDGCSRTENQEDDTVEPLDEEENI